ncbi:hypothetical protein LCGC14_2722390, partial [marine sediment metagenome]
DYDDLVTERERLYERWRAMVSRCHDPRHPAHKNYGARGVVVCARWRSSFAAFLEDMGWPSEGATIEREDNAGPYSPANCRWATRAEQNRNTRRNRWVTYQGETLCITDWARRYGLHPPTLRFRLLRGMSIEQALTAPINEEQARRARA